MGLVLSRKRPSDIKLDLSHTRTFVYHRVLRRNFHFIAEHSLALIREPEDARPLADELVAYAAILADVLCAHQIVADEVIYPYYKKRLVLIMDEYTAEHKKLAAFCQAVKARAQMVRARRSVTTDDLRQLRRSSLAISMALGPMYQKEELEVTRDILRTMKLKQHRRLARRAHRRMRVLLEAHRSIIKGIVFYSLCDSERPLFDGLPDNFKNPVLAEWKEAMRPYLSFTYNPPDDVLRSKIFEAYANQELELDRPLQLPSALSDSGDEEPEAESEQSADGSNTNGTEGTADKTPARPTAADKKLKPLTLRGTLPRSTRPPVHLRPAPPPPEPEPEESESSWTESSSDGTDRPEGTPSKREERAAAKRARKEAAEKRRSLAASNASKGLAASDVSGGGSLASSNASSYDEDEYYGDGLMSPRAQVARKRLAAFEYIEEERQRKEREAWENHRREIERERIEKQKTALVED
eukprot:TRINITY_DN5746_c0_g1_i1.p1 TRINITY_DN5746_c0_g1~~TRINITY_DN5746_c0_g1_i1.p1  ORF type:complete len:469 (+),score=109.05 TRINITY_DN5746_c0_g1_i1:300-1706(+)